MKLLRLTPLALLIASIACAGDQALTLRVNVPSGLAAQTLPVLTTASLADLRPALGEKPASGLITGLEVIAGSPRRVPGQMDVAGDQVRIALLLPSEPSGPRLIRLQPGTAAATDLAPLKVSREGAAVTITNQTYQITHDPARNAGMPSRIVFPQTGKVFDSFTFNDRVWEPAVQGFPLAGDAAAEVSVVAAGPLYAAVQVKARYERGEAPVPGGPRAV